RHRSNGGPMWCVVALLSTVPSVGAEPEDVAAPSVHDQARAKALLTTGQRAYAEHRYDDALAAFESAYALSGTPAVLLSIADAYERLGNTGGAVTALRRYRPYALPRELQALDARIRDLGGGEPPPTPGRAPNGPRTRTNAHRDNGVPVAG
ncbi:MAG: hypothetical protein ABMB14_41125, partial [Myxococcota bacterium]